MNEWMDVTMRLQLMFAADDCNY